MVKNVPNSEKEFSFNYLEQISIYPLLSEEQEKKLFLQYQKDGDLDAYWSLYFCNLRLSVFSAKKEYKNFINIDFWDLVQENNLILMKIIKNYDLSKGKFSTYALNVMHNQLREYIIDYETSISVKYKKSDEYRKYQRILKENRKQGKEPLEEEILSQIKIEKKHLKRA